MRCLLEGQEQRAAQDAGAEDGAVFHVLVRHEGDGRDEALV